MRKVLDFCARRPNGNPQGSGTRVWGLERNGLRAVALLFFAATAAAQESGIQLGTWVLYPSAGASIGYDDNVALTSSDEIDSLYLLFSPAVRLEKDTRRSRIQVEYRAEYADYLDSSEDNYLDQLLGGLWQYDPTVRSDLEVSAELSRGHDRRGEGLREGSGTVLEREVDEYDNIQFGGRYGYGANGARGRIEAFADWNETEYTNNRDFTTRGDFDQWRYGVEFQYRIGGRTVALAQVVQSDINYRSANRDSEERAYGLGISWQASERTRGKAVVGQLQRDFDDAVLPGFKGAFWEVSASWTPVSRSEFGLLTRRATDESFGASGFVLREETELSWRYNWRPRLLTSVDFGWMDEDFQPGPRDDDVVSFSVSADYQFRPWLLLGAGFRKVERESSLPEFNYDRSEFLLTVEMSP